MSETSGHVGGVTVRELDLGAGVTLPIFHIVGGNSGPRVAILAGVHGDEFEGQVAVRRLLATLDVELLRGEVVVVPRANPPAVDARTRISPADGLNLAREFPGSDDGTVTQRAAAAISESVIAGSDLLIDLHSAGRDFAMPLLAGYPAKSGDLARRAAHAFGAPLVWEHDAVAPGRSLSTALDLGVPCLYVEGSGGGGLRGEEIDVYVGGLFRILALLDMYPAGDRSALPTQTILRGGDGNLDESYSSTVEGWCVARASAGDIVSTGSPIADIVRDDGTIGQTVTASGPGMVIFLRRRADVVPGDAIAALAPVPE